MPISIMRRIKTGLGASVAAILQPRYFPLWLKTLIVQRSGLVDKVWYEGCTGREYTSNRAVARSFVTSESDPENALNPLFSADWYRTRYGFRGTPGEALIHYVMFGERASLQPNPWFNPGFFRVYNSDPGKGTALVRYWRGWLRSPFPHPHFDGNWYLWRYPDVAESNSNPLAHFLTHGMAEGREPNAYFSARWYLLTFPDVRQSNQLPAQHFCLYGAGEMRSPGPNFDMRRYADQYPDQADSGLDPLGHYLAIGRGEGRNVGTRYLHLWELTGSKERVVHKAGHEASFIDVIVPVYKGLEETRSCLQALMASKINRRIRVHVYNDASPQQDVTDYLRELATREPIILVENPVNLGFVGTVNAAMHRAMSSSDCAMIILLNSDTEVANDWVDRLAAHAAKSSAVGTVTALSNNATICSYPQIGVNGLPDSFTVAEIDRTTSEVNAGESVDIPTAVGFCMLITRDCLQRVGYFDEEAFGRGYGEENDFCMRASAMGYRHLLALDVFVKHVGEVSFADDSQSGKLNAGNVIRARYPDYDVQVARFCALDPSRTARLRLTFALWRAHRKAVVAIITHDLGGGTERQVLSICERLSYSCNVIVIRPSVGHKSLIRIENFSPHDGFNVIVDAIDGHGFANLLELIGVDSAQIHHLYDHGDMVRDGLARARIPFTFHLHDYFVICPQITLTTSDQEYCGEPDASGCDTCIALRPALGSTDIRNWRDANEWAVLNAQQVLAPSHDAADRIKRYLDVDPVVEYHEPFPSKASPSRRSDQVSDAAPLRVVILGVLSLTKGRKKIFEAIRFTHQQQLPVTFHLIGDPQGQFPDCAEGRFTYTGVYTEADLGQLLAEARPDIFLFASAAPETYSFTLTTAIATGRPIIATDLGAFAERLADYQGAWLYPHAISGSQLASTILTFARSRLPELFSTNSEQA